MNEQWYYGQNGVQKGPVTLGEMQQLLRNGHVRADDLVWREGMANWAPASSIPELSPAGPAIPVPPPTTAVPPQPAGPVPYQSFPLNPQDAALQSRATTAMVLGICSIVFSACVCSPIGLGLGIAAVVMGKNAENAPNAGNAKAAFVCGIIGITISLITCIPQYRFAMH